MSGKSNFYETSVLNVMRATNITAPATVYAALFTTAPTDAYTSGSPTGTEVSGNAYARQACGFSAPSGASPTSITNGSDILYPVQTPSGYGTVVAFSVMSASSAGNLHYWNTLTNKTFSANDQAVFRASNLTVTEE